MNQDAIIVLDVGSTENERLLKELGEMGVYAELRSCEVTLNELLSIPNIKGIIVNGGSNRNPDGSEMEISKDIYNCELPVLLVDHLDDAPWPEDKAERKQTLAYFIMICGIKTDMSI